MNLCSIVVDMRPASADTLVSFSFFEFQEFGNEKKSRLPNCTWTLHGKLTSMSNERPFPCTSFKHSMLCGWRVPITTIV